MFDGVNADRALGEGGGALDGLNFGDAGVDEGFIGEVDAAELEAIAFGSGLQRESDFFSGVE